MRVSPDGRLSGKPHPQALGSALTHRFITTDFSEALLEFVTPAMSQTWQALRFLCDIHQFIYERLEHELLWVASMPCRLPDDPDIPLARYGSSNVGRMKTIYRNGLGYRYGRSMQTIAGIHFNYSLPDSFWPVYQEQERDAGSARDFRSAAYLGLLRNFRRFGWLVLYLTGASPALCKSFSAAPAATLAEFDATTLYEPYATSLRMSDLGYSNRRQAGLDISLNRLDDYIADLTRAITTRDPVYGKIGVRSDGEYRQLSDCQLQIENEYYSPIRPKRVARSGERPTAALRRDGIEYVEVRSLDLNVVDPVGINQNIMRFLEAFLVYCLLADSPELDEKSWKELTANHTETARRGRDPAFRLRRQGREVRLAAWAREVLDGTAAVAEILDGRGAADDYVQAVSAQAALIDEPEQTPSARLLVELRNSGRGFFEFAMEAARCHREYFRSLAPLSPQRLQMFEEETRASLERQRQVEADDALSFEEYLAAYYRSG